MCGIAGIISRNENLMQYLLKAQAVQMHRGPDAQAACRIAVDRWNLYFAHQRLAILDLSESANQPMYSDSGDACIIYNGEVYNYEEIRYELEGLGYRFRSHSDTEVVLKSVLHWGPEDALKKFNGMWAFALLDSNRKRLILARDRVGIKPLYIYQCDDNLYFSSEIKAIAEMVDGKLGLNHEVIGRYLVQSLLEVSNDTFFEDVEKLPAAHYCVLDLSKENIDVVYKRYWQLPDPDNESRPESNYLEEVRDLFRDSVRLRLRSDVPVGVLVSGGIDSSSIAAVMHDIVSKDASLNLIGMVNDDPECDEGPFIDIIARELGRNIHRVRFDIGPDQFIDRLRAICWHSDQPVGTFSCAAHHMLMERAREYGITVILSGQGGDELFCGYKKYLGFYVYELFEQGRYLDLAKVIYKFLRRGTVISQFSFNESKRYLPSYLRSVEPDIRGPHLKEYKHVRIGLVLGMSVQEKQVADILNFSVPALVHSEDRMSMACSREIRVPFLDHRLIERAVSLPADTKIYDGWTKYALRTAMESILPSEITWRKDKRGFTSPEADWLRNRLKDVVTDHFSDPACLMYKHGLVDQKNLIRTYDKYCGQGPRSGTISCKDIFKPMALETWLRLYDRYLS